jgi:hypothetical protein
MKKQNLTSLRLNKKSISHLQNNLTKGGADNYNYTRNTRCCFTETECTEVNDSSIFHCPQPCIHSFEVCTGSVFC